MEAEKPLEKEKGSLGLVERKKGKVFMEKKNGNDFPYRSLPLCMQNKLIIHSRYCFVEQYVHPRESNI